MSYPNVLPHDAPKQIAQDLFVVHGCVRPNAVARFTRNMAIVHDQGKLTLINPVRMDDAGLAHMEELGEVAHVLRLGPMHGMDDPFYVDRYNAEFCSFEGGELPFPNARLFAFSHMTETEGAILLERSPGVLLTCDAIQSYATAPHKPHTNWLIRLMMPSNRVPPRNARWPPVDETFSRRPRRYKNRI
jgi:hypothetical protein